jgi:hypothetical protein
MARTPNINYLRRRKLSRTDHSQRLLELLNAQATRLELTVTEVFALLRLSGARGVEDEPTPDPE